MKLNLSQIKEVTLGASGIEEIDNGVHFFRFTKEQEELYRNRHLYNKHSHDPYTKTFSTSGVQMRFRTDSKSLFLINISIFLYVLAPLRSFFNTQWTICPLFIGGMCDRWQNSEYVFTNTENQQLSY